MTASLNCPTCGAPASGPEASRCDYCGSTLTTIGCPSCFGVMFAGMQFCPHCGAKADRVLDESRTLPCPGCKGTMRQVTLGTTLLFECEACHSTWVNAGIFADLCLNREARGAIAAMVGADAKVLVKASSQGVRYLPCPVCSRLMNRQNFGKRSGIIIDVCKGDGAWFDAGELQSVMAFVDSGGFERAREQDAEQRREEERARQALLAAGAQQAAASRSTFGRDDGRQSLGDQLISEALSFLFR